jgi:hypothetical protein
LLHQDLIVLRVMDCAYIAIAPLAVDCKPADGLGWKERLPAVADDGELQQPCLRVVGTLASLRAEQRSNPSPTPLMPNVRRYCEKVADRLTDDLLQDPEQGRETLREVLGERIKLKPDESGQFLWAEYPLGIAALLPSAKIMVAGQDLTPI